jgi:hypothetical protein
VVRVVAWLTILGLSALVVANTVPYFSLGGNFAFLVEKGALSGERLWRTCFFAHVSGGMLCLATGPLLLWNGLLRRSKAAHRWLGRAYALAVLGWAGPAGLYLSIHSKGGLSGHACFLLLDVAWIAATALAIRHVTARRVAEHRRWMMRSYALALSAVFFRVFQLGFHVGGMADEPNYVLSLWLSLGASVVAGEVLARRPSPAPALNGVSP